MGASLNTMLKQIQSFCTTGNQSISSQKYFQADKIYSNIMTPTVGRFKDTGPSDTKDIVPNCTGRKQYF
jgi:hypothetical protein